MSQQKPLDNPNPGIEPPSTDMEHPPQVISRDPLAFLCMESIRKLFPTMQPEPLAVEGSDFAESMIRDARILHTGTLFEPQSVMESVERNSFEESPIIKPILEGLRAKIVPDRWDTNSLDLQLGRMTLIKYSSFTLISKNWIKPFAEWIGQRKCLEIMAGHGMLSKALRDEGVNVIAATDDFTWKTPPIDLIPEHSWFQPELFWTDVEKMDADESIRKYGKEAELILCSWPPYSDPAAYHALQRMREMNPEALFVLFGEGPDGCTADEGFFDEAVPVEDESFEACFEHYANWLGIKDYPQLYQ